MIAVLAPAWSVAAEVAVSDFLACEEILEDSARLACFDGVVDTARADEPAPVPVAEPAPAPAAEPAPAVAAEPAVEAPVDDQPEFVPLSDDVGLAAHERDDDGKQTAIRARVTRCKEGATGKYFFYFENGQVWQETNQGRRDFDDCDFYVTITRDTFGYRLSPEGETYRVRITRVK